MFPSTRISLRIILSLAASACLFGQAKPEPDVLIFTNGKKLIGHLKSATGAKVVFKSDMAGEVTVEWSKIKELHSASKFAAIPKDDAQEQGGCIRQVNAGALAMADQKLEVTNPQRHRRLFRSPTCPMWSTNRHSIRRSKARGSFKAGKAPLLSASRSPARRRTLRLSTPASNLVRSDPAGSWLRVRTKTTVDFTASYSKITQPGTPSIKNAFYHADAEEDFYASPRLFLLGGAIFDHSYSQGLDLQQTYDGGLGVVAHKAAHSGGISGGM